MFNLENLDDVRDEMISEIQDDISKGELYISDRLNATGKIKYPDILINAVETKDINGFILNLGMEYFNSYYMRKKPKGGFTQVSMPQNANIMLCEGEFNRFYIRGVCLKSIKRGQQYVQVYRARISSNPRPKSQALEGELLEAEKLLDDLRKSIGIDTALGLPPGPNSGMSVKLSNNS